MDAEVKPYPLITSAIRSGSVEQLDALFDRFPEMLRFYVPGFGTWLHHAAAQGALSIVAYLIEKGFDLNDSSEREGVRPLQMAADAGHLHVVRYLLGRGAIMDTSESVQNPLFGAIIGRSPEIARLLLDAGIDTSPRTRLGEVDKTLDAVAFAMLRGEREIAHLIALHNSAGDETAAQAAMAEGLRIAYAITEEPVDD